MDRDDNLPQNKVVCGNVIKHRPLLVLDKVFEGADSLAIPNLDREYIVYRISKLQQFN